MPSIFVCYRREDTAAYAGRLHDSLAKAFGSDSIFLDIDFIEPGEDFDQALKTTLNHADVVLVLIGPQWCEVREEDGSRRIDNVDDYVRVEVATALQRGVRLIPVLLGGAKTPKSSSLPDDLKTLTRRQSIEITDIRWAYDTERLAEAIRRINEKKDQAPPVEIPIAPAAAAAIAAPTLSAPAVAVPHPRETVEPSGQRNSVKKEPGEASTRAIPRRGLVLWPIVISLVLGISIGGWVWRSFRDNQSTLAGARPLEERNLAQGIDAFNRGRLYDALDRIEQAIDSYERAFRYLPDDDPNSQIAKARLETLRAERVELANRLRGH